MQVFQIYDGRGFYHSLPTQGHKYVFPVGAARGSGQKYLSRKIGKNGKSQEDFLFLWYNILHKIYQNIVVDSRGKHMREDIKINDRAQALSDQLVAVLESVYDPEIELDIYNLGLVYEINLDEQGLCTVTDDLYRCWLFLRRYTLPIDRCCR